MVLVFYFIKIVASLLLFIIIFSLLSIILIGLILLLSSIRIKTSNFKIDNFKVNDDYSVLLEFYFLNRIKYLSFYFDKCGIERITKRITNSKMFSIIKKIDLPSDDIILKNIDDLKIFYEKLDFSLYVGLEEADITAVIVGVLSIIVGIIISKITNNNNDNKGKQYICYKIAPVYNKDIMMISLESIIRIKIVHIIYVIFNFNKKGRDKNGRSSNRRAYAYSHGFN